MHLLISAPAGGDDFTKIIALGDYIDLPSLTVAGYPVDAVGNPYESTVPGYGKFSVADKELTGHGRLLRLIVVGINSFNGKNGNNTPHVVFQFQNTPGTHWMDPSYTNVGGYKDSEVRKYLVKVGGVGGNFLAGLTAAGVPASVLWAPSRRVWNGYLSSDATGSPSNTTVDTIADKLFLPTEWEMIGRNRYAHATYETVANQGRFEYYTDSDHRMKYNSANTGYVYWSASPCYEAKNSFCYNGLSSYNDGVYAGGAVFVRGIAPAFCVK